LRFLSTAASWHSFAPPLVISSKLPQGHDFFFKAPPAAYRASFIFPLAFCNFLRSLVATIFGLRRDPFLRCFEVFPARPSMTDSDRPTSVKLVPLPSSLPPGLEDFSFPRFSSVPVTRIRVDLMTFGSGFSPSASFGKRMIFALSFADDRPSTMFARIGLTGGMRSSSFPQAASSVARRPLYAHLLFTICWSLSFCFRIALPPSPVA